MVRIHSGVPHKPNKTQKIRDEAKSARGQICVHLCAIQKKFKNGGTLRFLADLKKLVEAYTAPVSIVAGDDRGNQPDIDHEQNTSGTQGLFEVQEDSA